VGIELQAALQQRKLIPRPARSAQASRFATPRYTAGTRLRVDSRLNLGKVRFNHLRRWNGGIYSKLDSWQLENNGKHDSLTNPRPKLGKRQNTQQRSNWLLFDVFLGFQMDSNWSSGETSHGLEVRVAARNYSVMADT
jgi:hypothetical protein